ncbi:uncharacterized protein LOC111049668 isoform X2 [Nilaparvata lugens]|uniref:uncharacterized protein LOC111049668 isoform X2 n=1 Tax=Nilaparvata lugens TaxID=108931 RepID=UPI00193EA346|nr:uncharacterized protein LOC111049668 isoform X2 [Nilaparvata lugens]
MGRTMSFIFFSLSMTTLMFASLMEATSSGNDHNDVFTVFDRDGDGYITKKDVENFLKSSSANSISNKEIVNLVYNQQ